MDARDSTLDSFEAFLKEGICSRKPKVDGNLFLFLIGNDGKSRLSPEVFGLFLLNDSE